MKHCVFKNYRTKWQKKKNKREQKVIGPTTAFSFFGSRIKGIECILQMRPAGTHQDDFAIFETRIPTTSRYLVTVYILVNLPLADRLT